MNRTLRLRTAVAAAAFALILSACFSSNPTRQQGDGGEAGGGNSGSMPSPGGSSSPGGGGQSSTDGNPSADSTATATDSGNMPSNTSRSSTTGQQGESGRLPGEDGGEDGAADIRVASAQRPGAGTNAPGAPESDMGGAAGEMSDEPDVSVAEALEGANAAVDAAAEAVSDAEATIARAREVPPSDSTGGGDVDSFDPWATPGAGEKTSESDSASGGGQPQQSDESDSAAPGGGSQGEESFDPFADYGEQAGASGQPVRINKTGSLRIADDALATARAALNRARRALITAAGAATPGESDSDAEAVQLAAARAAMEAAAEAVIASAIAVMAASDAYADHTDQEAGDDSSEEALAESIAMVVAVVQRDMRNAAEALDATGELLAAAGSLIGILSAGERQETEEGSGSDPGERVAQLEEELDQSLAVFDDRMQSEGSNVVPGMGGEDSELAGAEQTGSSTDPRMNSGRSGSREGPRQGGRDLVKSREDVEWNAPRNQDDTEPMADSETQNEEFNFEDVNAQDDDIVARQLREAAMAETDPELREALWEEYRSYKESLETGEADAN